MNRRIEEGFAFWIGLILGGIWGVIHSLFRLVLWVVRFFGDHLAAPICAVGIIYPATRDVFVPIGIVILLLRDTPGEIVKRMKAANPMRTVVKIDGSVKIPSRPIRTEEKSP